MDQRQCPGAECVDLPSCRIHLRRIRVVELIDPRFLINRLGDSRGLRRRMSGFVIPDQSSSAGEEDNEGGDTEH